MNNNRICAIHQPNFFPWLGYFDKIKKCDKFVILDNVQYQKKGGTWSNRVAVNIQGQRKWITAPINRKSGVWNVNETTFKDDKWRSNLIKTLQTNYSKTPFFDTYKEFIFDLVLYKSNDLVEYNVNAIQSFCQLLNIDIQNKFVYSSSFNFKTTSNELLIDLTRAVSCNIYMAGGGASNYQDVDLFKQQNIGFIYQDFEHPSYHQANSEMFLSGLSIIDFVFNQGAKCINKEKDEQ